MLERALILVGNAGFMLAESAGFGSICEFQSIIYDVQYFF